MKRFCLSFLLLGCAAAAFAAGRADDIVARLAAGFGAMKGYEVAFTITADEHTLAGSYAVEGDRYYLRLGDAEVFGDGKTRYEVDNRRREVTLSGVDGTSHNLLNDPVRAFNFLGSDYRAALVSERDGVAVVTLTPVSKEASLSGTVTVTVATAAMRPVSLEYDYEGERIAVRVDGVAPLKTPLRTFAKKNFAEYEFIDFR